MSVENCGTEHYGPQSIGDAAVNQWLLEFMNPVRLETVQERIRNMKPGESLLDAQFGSMLRYKCALRSKPLFEVDAAYTSQICSKCGSIHKPDGKQFTCLTCGHNDHRDVNATFNIARRGMPIDGSSSGLSVPGLRPIGGPPVETIGGTYVRQ